jgi:EpsI family protein
MRSTTIRALVVSACLVGGMGVLARTSQSEIVPTRAPLQNLPLSLGDWRGRVAPDFTPEILAVLGVDEYVNRVYYAPQRPPAGLYVGYYESQRQGDTMHSPLNCLPGAGWTPVSQSRIQVPVRDGAGERMVEINSFIIEKGLDRQAVLYWYQSHGRVVASEYWGRFYMILDAMRTNRTDGAMVRVIVPIRQRDDDALAAEAQATAIGFVQELFPVLSEYLPV